MGMKTITLGIITAVLLACGGENKPAAHASGSSDCPEGMVKEGGDCVAPEGQSGPGKAASTEEHTSTSSTSSTSTVNTNTANTANNPQPPPQQPKTAYDRDAVELVLRRAANQVKGHCGQSTDDNGKANGPWGTTKVSITLGRNGHIRDITIPDPYNDKPTGRCAVQAFHNLIFPPYPASADVVIEWDVELIKPGK